MPLVCPSIVEDTRACGSISIIAIIIIRRAAIGFRTRAS